MGIIQVVVIAVIVLIGAVNLADYIKKRKGSGNSHRQNGGGGQGYTHEPPTYSNGENYYERLELDRTASAEEIKKRYRELALRYHPDTNSSPTSALQFRRLNEAYEALSSPEKRRQYDATL